MSFRNHRHCYCYATNDDDGAYRGRCCVCGHAIRVGTQDVRSWDDALLLVLHELRSVMIERHRKYGPQNIARHGELGCIIRAGDKLARLERGQDAPDDSIDDSWIDLANYAIIALMLRRGWWSLPARCLEEGDEG